MIKKTLSLVLLFSFVGLTFLLAQDKELVELAKKEKARRESLKGQKVKVITNKELENLTKTPSLILSGSSQATEAQKPATTTANSSSNETPVIHRVTVENQPPVSPSNSQPSASSRASTEGVDVRGSSLEEAWKKAKEYVELLTLKMNSLWQEFYSLNDMKSRDYIQQQISETYEKLLKAQEEEAQLRMEYEKQINQKKSESASPIWIK
ncbi:MAG: hypothetical protein ACPLZD_09455 [Candidatus Saccharicenans sp.]|nr:MAG: hypothetical protein C0168_05625 [Candidatus Aminicenantes bacterium]HEK85334.1 hypothetical protein [Candidatus Aminicenantes bacterium]